MYHTKTEIADTGDAAADDEMIRLMIDCRYLSLELLYALKGQDGETAKDGRDLANALCAWSSSYLQDAEVPPQLYAIEPECGYARKPLQAR